MSVLPAIRWTLPGFAALLFLCACASSGSSIPEGDWRSRIQTQENQGVVVSVAVPSAKESKKLFSMPLYKQGVQPVWLEMINNRDTAVTFLPVGLDPQYFTPLEVANNEWSEKDSETPAALVNLFFLDQGIRVLRLAPGEKRGGFVFSKLDEGTKAFNVDFTGNSDANQADFVTFTFFVPVPGLTIDHYDVDWENLYDEDEWIDPDKRQLIEIIEGFPCCVTNKSGTGSGDPLNLVIIGQPGDVYTAFIRAGWDETEKITKTSSLKTMVSFLSGGEYRYSPVSGLYVFERPQDVAFQKARENIHERNHLRLWMSRARYKGIPVWMGQISRDIGVRFTSKTITTHKIDPNVDETREYLLEDLAYAQSLSAIGYVGGVGEVTIDQPRGNLTGDPWFTDGFRLVLWVSPEPVSIDKLRVLNWRNPYQ